MSLSDINTAVGHMNPASSTMSLLLRHLLYTRDKLISAVKNITQELINDNEFKSIQTDISKCLSSQVAEKLELLVSMVQSILDDNLDSNQDTNAESKCPQDLSDRIFQSVCLPLLTHPAVYKTHSGSLAVQMMRMIFETCSLSVQNDFWNLCCECLDLYNTEKKSMFGHREIAVISGRHSVMALVDVINAAVSLNTLPGSNNLAKRLFSSLCTMIAISEEKLAGVVIATVLPKLVHTDEASLTERLNKVWKLTQELYARHGQKIYKNPHPEQFSERPYILLCGLANSFFPEKSNIDSPQMSTLNLATDELFWDIVQSGFFATATLTRKRAMYLLKRVIDITETAGLDVQSGPEKHPVFWWSPSHKEELSVMWNDYILLVETLEEKQVHVIRPILPRLQNLVQATALRTEGPALLHTSWLTAVFQRAASHESSTMTRWGILEMLNLDLTKCPLIHQGLEDFFYGPVVKMMTEAAMYQKPLENSPGQSPPAAEALERFFISCHAATQGQQRTSVLKNMISSLTQEVWNGAALLFVSRGLAAIPAAPIIDKETLSHVRCLAAGSTHCLEALFRGAVQGYLLQMVMKLLNLEEVKPADILPLLGSFKREEMFSFGSSLHEEWVHWLKESSTRSLHWSPDDVYSCVADQITYYINDTRSGVYSVDNPDCLPAVRLLVLARAAALTAGEQNNPDSKLTSILLPVVNVLQTMYSHAYLSPHKADRTLAVLVTLTQEVQHYNGEETEVTRAIQRLILPCVPEILAYIQRRVDQEINQLSQVLSVSLYCAVVQQLDRWWQHMASSVAKLQSLIQTCVKIMQLPTELTEACMIRKYSAMSLLATVADMLLSHDQIQNQFATCAEILTGFVQNMEIVNGLSKPVSPISEGDDDEIKEKLPDWGRLSCEYIASQWACVCFILNQPDAGGILQDLTRVQRYTEACLEALDVVRTTAGAPVLKCLKVLLPKLDEELVTRVISLSWNHILEDMKHSCFWELLELFVDLAYQHCTLSTAAMSDTQQLLLKIAHQMMKYGEERLGMVNMLLNKLISYWREDDQHLKSAEPYLDLLVQMAMYGPIHSRGFRFNQDVRIYIQNMGENLTVNQHIKGKALSDSLVRAAIVTWLSSLDTTRESHTTFVHQLIPLLIKQHQDLFATKNHNNFCNSFSHRQKQRVMALLLVLQPFIDEELVEPVFAHLQDALVRDMHMSVRTLVEWLMILIIHRFPYLIQRIWTYMCQNSGKKAAILCSYMVVIGNSTKLHTANQEGAEFFDHAMEAVIPWCVSHHFSTKTFSQAILFMLWGRCQTLGLTQILQKYNVINTFLDFHKDIGNSTRNATKILANHVLQMHPIKDFSIQTIYHTLPQMANLTEEEWISPQVFTESGWQESDQHTMVLMNPDDHLTTCEPGSWKLKPVGGDGDVHVRQGDVQKKIIPWKCMLPDNDTDVTADYDRKTCKKGGLVLVTSLIDKVPNLGGLCRTCEIFGVSEYIIGSLKYISDQMFESLSVTAHKWIPIKEVKPHMLKDYLLYMRAEGYTLVGAEQTNNSVCLTDYKFPKKTLLILGNEKEGIPVDLIQLLDACVEIPQQGVIRSLNVHVSGALLIWEYSRQMMQAETEAH